MASKSEIDQLTTAYMNAAAVHAAAIPRMDPVEICTALRATFVAEAAMLRACGGRLDFAAADAIRWEIEDIDAELADLAVGKLRPEWR